MSRGLLRLFVVCVALALGCTPLPEVRVGEAVRPSCPDDGSADYYFPVGSLIPNDPEGDLRQRKALGASYTAAGLRSLSCGGTAAEEYRVFWGGGYGITPVVVTTSASAVSVVEFLAPNLRAFTVNRTAQATLDSSRIDELRQRLATISFWTARPFVDIEGEGNAWMIEARRGTSYKVITRVAMDSAVVRSVRSLIGTTGLSVPEGMRLR